MFPALLDGGDPRSSSRFLCQTLTVKVRKWYVRAGGPASARISWRGMRDALPSAVLVSTKSA